MQQKEKVYSDLSGDHRQLDAKKEKAAASGALRCSSELRH